MSELFVTEHVPKLSIGDRAARIGTRAWADSIRLTLVSLVQHLGEEDERLAGYIDFTKEHRAWTLMNKPDGSFFVSLEEFCAFRRPYGLGTLWATLEPFIKAGMAKQGKAPDEIERTLQLETVPEAQPTKAGPGRGHKAEREKKETPATELQPFSGGQPNHETTRRLRAINRAPDAVKDAYRDGRISQTLAAKLGPKNPTPDTASQIALIATAIRKITDRKQVDAIVREKLGVGAPTALERVLRLVVKLSDHEWADVMQRENQRRDTEKTELA